MLSTRAEILAAIRPHMRRCSNAEKHAAAYAAATQVDIVVRVHVQNERRALATRVERLEADLDRMSKARDYQHERADRVYHMAKHWLGELFRAREQVEKYKALADARDAALYEHERAKPTLWQRWWSWWACGA